MKKEQFKCDRCNKNLSGRAPLPLSINLENFDWCDRCLEDFLVFLGLKNDKEK